MKDNQTQYYGGFWLRFCSSFIDSILLIGFSMVLDYVLMGKSPMPTTAGAAPVMTASNIYSTLFSLTAGFVYFSLIQGWFKGTVGKHVMGLTLLDAKTFEKVSIGQSVGRYFVTIASTIFFFGGYLSVGWNVRKQAWHDRAAGTVVVKKNCVKKLKDDCDDHHATYSQAA